MATALITGIGGFVGQHLAEYARRDGHTVVGLDRAGSGRSVDLLNFEAVRELVAQSRPELVFHLAGLLRSPEVRSLYEINVSGTANLLEALVAEKLRPRVVLSSSSAVYGSPPDDARLLEEATLRPLTHYAASKVAQEVIARRFVLAEGLPVLIARPFNIIGPGQPSTLAAGAFAEQVSRAELSAERVIRVGDLSAGRDFVDVRDVARAYCTLASKGTVGATYNVCAGRAVPMQRCLDVLLAAASVPLKVEYDAARSRPHDVRAQVGDPTAMERDTGWAPTFSFETSIQDLLVSWRETQRRRAGAS